MMDFRSFDKFELSKKTGFKILNPDIPVIILDQRGKVFYDNSRIKNPDSFNLPEGIYYRVQGDIVRLKKPVHYNLNKLPNAERNYDWPNDFSFHFGNVSRKAVIDWVNKSIVFDHKLKNLSTPELYYILYHEFAHAKYRSEKYADRLAENLMLIKGFNPSQTGNAPITSLSEKQLYRKRDALIRNLTR